MVGTLWWRAPRPGAVQAALSLIAVQALVGCTAVVDGTGRARPAEAVSGPPPALGDLLIDPQRFPDGYPGAVVAAPAVGDAIREIDGAAAGSVVAPPHCTPPPPPTAPGDAAAIRGVDPATSSTLVVVLTRVPVALATRHDQLANCASFTVGSGERGDTVTVSLLARPPVDADHSLAVQQRLSDADGTTRQALALVAQIADVRITAAWINPDDQQSPDTEALDTLFTDAVLKVRRDGTG